MEIKVWRLDSKIRGAYCPHCDEKCYIRPDEERQAAYGAIDHRDARHIGVAAIQCPSCRDWAACYYPDPPRGDPRPRISVPA